MGRGGGCKTIALGSVFSLSGALTPGRVVTLGFSESIWITKLFKSYWYKQGKAPEVTSAPLWRLEAPLVGPGVTKVQGVAHHISLVCFKKDLSFVNLLAYKTFVWLFSIHYDAPILFC